MQLEKRFQSGQNLNLHELLQSDILSVWCLNGLNGRAVLNWGRAYHGNATKHRDKTDDEGTHVSVKVCPPVRRNTYEMGVGGIPGRSSSTGGFKLRDRLLGDKVGQYGRIDQVIYILEVLIT